MIYGSVCSGIEAATAAWHPLGWRPSFFSEIDQFPRAVLKHHYPRVPLHGDFTSIGAGDYGAIDLLVGGTPCQSFSIAGLRGGLGDDRGNLALEYLRLADRLRTRWLVWENVPGVLSSAGGRDFGAILGGMVELGYGFAYRVLDAQYVRVDGLERAVPQRRRRVFVVGHLGDWRRAAAVLFERESLCGHPAPRREAGQGVAPTISARPSGGGGLGTDFDCDGGLICADVASTLDAHFHDKQGLENQHVNAGMPLFVAHSLRGEGFDASEDGTGRGTPIVPIAIQERAVSENPDAGPDGAGFRQDGASYTLEARTVPQAVAFDCKGSQVQHDDSGSSPTLRAMGHAGSHANAGGQLAVAFQDRFRGDDGRGYDRPPPTSEGVTGALETVKPWNIATPWAVRRLTPRECERLQGFPDDYTLIPYRRGMSADGPRYKALGNSMAVNVMRWIGERIDMVDRLP